MEGPETILDECKGVEVITFPRNALLYINKVYRRYSPKGDVLNLISIKDRTAREVFKKIFSPIHLIIDPNSGKFNNALNLERDQVLGFNALLN